MELGAFSVSLAVKDLAVSRAFYEKLGFAAVAGDAAHGYQILRNGTTTIGLFQGMFERNILTFNPGWDADCNEMGSFDDVRDIRAALKERGVELTTDIEADGLEGDGPASIAFLDPDGNPILIDQHVGRAKG